jgi:hypothetical protein
LAAATSCSPITRAAILNYTWPCLTDAEVDLVLPPAEALVDASPGSEQKQPWETELVTSSCDRRVYQRRGSEFAVVKTGRRISLTTLPNAPPRTAPDAIACLNQATSEILRLNLSDADTILKAYRERFPQDWDEPNKGPAKWVDCSMGKGPAYFDSIATLLHESTHDLRNGDCLFVPNVKQNTCCDLKDRSSVPRPSAVVIEQFSGQHSDAVAVYVRAQKLY